jgi:hypothetical protein
MAQEELHPKPGDRVFCPTAGCSGLPGLVLTGHTFPAGLDERGHQAHMARVKPPICSHTGLASAGEYRVGPRQGSSRQAWVLAPIRPSGTHRSFNDSLA